MEQNFRFKVQIYDGNNFKAEISMMEQQLRRVAAVKKFVVLLDAIDIHTVMKQEMGNLQIFKSFQMA